MNVTLRGADAISDTFARAKAAGRAAFMPYWMLGYPDMPTSIQVVQAMLRSGADAIELGVPFSDPVADGVVVQRAGQLSLDAGTTLSGCIAAVEILRKSSPATPFLLMCHINPFMNYGLERLVADAQTVGVDGFIIPDLPPDEAAEMLRLCEGRGLALIEFLAPTSNAERIRLVSQTARGFIYLVSVTGVTGVRPELPPGLGEYVARIRSATDLPLAIGFGVSTPDQAARAGAIADGVIVGSAMIREFDKGGIEALTTLTRSIRAAC